MFFAFKVARLLEVQAHDDDADATAADGSPGTRHWQVRGQVFFASADAFIDAFDILGAEGRPVRIDVSQAHFWDVTAIAALDKVVRRLEHHGCRVEVVGLNRASEVLIDRLSVPR